MVRQKKRRTIVFPAMTVSKGYRSIELPKEVIIEWLFMQKLPSRKKGEDTEKTFIALLNSGTKLKPISMDIDFIPIPYIIVPTEFMEDFSIKQRDVLECGKYIIDR